MNEHQKKREEDGIVGVPTHPIAGGVGMMGGAAAGATIGMGVGPAGAVVGGLLGAVVGGLGGDAVASAFDEAEEADYWRERYSQRPYGGAPATYDDYAPAYRLGMEAYRRDPSLQFEEFEPTLATEWDQKRGTSNLAWSEARAASYDAWKRLKER
jgi:hypothetical protein